MVFDNCFEYEAKDGCTYLFDRDKRTWFKLCHVKELPAEVVEQVRHEIGCLCQSLIAVDEQIGVGG